MSKVFEALDRARREGRGRSVLDGAGVPDGRKEQKAPPAYVPEGIAPRTRASHQISSPSVPGTLWSARQSLMKLWPGARARSSPGLVIEDESASNVAEQFQVLRASLERSKAQREGSILMVASALAGEGKSFVCLNLAATLAMSGTRVLLVDADLRHPSLHRAFNLVPLNGLKGYLEGQCDFASSLHPTQLKGFTIVPAGGQLSFPSPLLSGGRMREFVARARSLDPAHFVLIDTPAALVAPDAQMLSRLVDGVLLVVGANSSPRAVVQETLQLFSDVTVLGVVLNRFRCSYSAARQSRYGGKYDGQEAREVG